MIRPDVLLVKYSTFIRYHCNTVKYFIHIYLLIFILLAGYKCSAQEIPGNYAPLNYFHLTNTFTEDTATIWRDMRLGRNYLYNSQDTALIYFDSALNLSRRIGLNEGMAKSLCNIALCNKSYDKMISTYLLALSYCHDWTSHIGDKNNINNVRGEIYVNLSSIYSDKSQYSLSVYYCYKVIEATQLYNPTSQVLVRNAYINLANVFCRLGKLDEAVYYDDAAYMLASMHKDSAVMAFISGNIATVYFNLKDTDKGKYYCQKSLDIAAHIKERLTGEDSVNLGLCLIGDYSTLATFYIEHGNIEQARDYASEAIRISEQTASKYMPLKEGLPAKYILGDAYYKLGNYKLAEKYLLNSLKEATTEDYLSQLENPHSILASLYNTTGQYKKAYEHQRAYSALEDSLYSGKNLQLVNDLEAKNKFIEQDRALIQKQLLLERRDEQIKVKNFWIGGVSLCSLLLGLLMITRYRSKQKLQEKKIHILQQQQEIIQLKAMMDGEEKERKRIARDLHDGVSQTMSAAKMNIIAIENEIDFKSDFQKAKFEKIIDLVDSSFKEVRTISHDMMPNALQEAGLALVIKQFVDNIDRNVIHINLYSKGLDEHFDNSIETILYRVIQECVNNVLKHSKADRLDISLNKDENGVSVTIEDNGIGFDKDVVKMSAGIGLKNIEARIHFLQGRIEFDTTPGNGTLVSIYVPLDTTGINE